VIEEAPAPGVTDYTRAMICNAAVKAAKAVDYVGAGTIEFIADASKGYIDPDHVWFMEMNTRLQVEHPVTEEITGVDLVEWQLRVASGEALPKRQDELSIDGWAMEARLYAEDPAKGFLPSIGKLDWFRLSTPDPNFVDVRYDMGVDWHDEVSPNYDPMLGKIISKGQSRNDATDHLITACRLANVWPVKTNLGFVSRCLEHSEFAHGDVDTGFIERNLDSLTQPQLPLEKMARWAATDLVEEHEKKHGLGFGFRLNSAALARAILVDDEGTRFDVDLLEDGTQAFGGFDVPDATVVQYQGESRRFQLFRGDNSGLTVFSDGGILSPMPGRIIAVMVAAGDAVTKGQKLLTLEAMKMEHTLVAPFDGVVAELNALAGTQVQVEALLARIASETKEAA